MNEPYEVSHRVTATRIAGTRWLRLIQRLSVSAERMGKEVRVVSLNDVLKEKADAIATAGDLRLYPSVEAALSIGTKP